MQEKEALKRYGVSTNTVLDVLPQNGLNVIQHLRLQRSIEAAPLEVIELHVVEQTVAIDITNLKYPDESLFAGVRKL